MLSIKWTLGFVRLHIIYLLTFDPKTKINLYSIQRLISTSQGTVAAFVRNRSLWIFCRGKKQYFRNNTEHTAKLQYVGTRQAMHVIVIFRRVRVTIVAVENQKYYIVWVWVCNISCPACKAHAHYYFANWSCHILPHYLINGTSFVKKFIEHKMCVLIFSTTFFPKLFSF